ncbi:MAG: tRNA epoxyqueuosine(34) reductase QueG [Dehalococcoidia bacterium]
MQNSLTDRLKNEARRSGFVACAVAAAVSLPETRRSFQERIEAGSYAGLPWFSVDRARRCTDPDLVLAGARSIVSLAAPYASDEYPNQPQDELRGKIARYAWGKDYHRALEKRLRGLCQFLEAKAPGTRSRGLVDYGPLAERAYAARAGLGWFGKSTNLLLPGVGSWVLLAEIVTTAELAPDPPLKKSCGACTRCVDACPTGAIVGGYAVDNQRCISFQTIENRGAIPVELRPLIGDRLFGCDICQEVCPVGRGAASEPLPELQPATIEASLPELIPLLQLDEEAFRARFAGRAIMRAKRDGFVRNACVVLGNLGDCAAVPALITCLRDSAALVRGHAAWALGRLGGEPARAAMQEALLSEPDQSVREELASALEAIETHRETTRAGA